MVHSICIGEILVIYHIRVVLKKKHKIVIANEVCWIHFLFSYIFIIIYCEQESTCAATVLWETPWKHLSARWRASLAGTCVKQAPKPCRVINTSLAFLTSQQCPPDKLLQISVKDLMQVFFTGLKIYYLFQNFLDCNSTVSTAQRYIFTDTLRVMFDNLNKCMRPTRIRLSMYCRCTYT